MASKQVVNFGAGPAKLPEEVLLKVQKDLLNFKDSNLSIMEISHRSTEYLKFNDDTQAAVKELLKVPDNYKILFMQGGGTGLFAAVPLNLMSRTGSADYFVTGSWSAKAAKEATKYGKVNLVLPKTDKYNDIPDPSKWKLDPKASYVYYCSNETIHGVEFPYIPDTQGVPLVADMSSNIMSRPIDVSKFGIIFAGAQKNIGPAGVTLVIIRDDLLGNPSPFCPTILDFSIMAKDNSVHNTPPTAAIYVMSSVFEWIRQQGGVEGMEKHAVRKSQLLYDTIDHSQGFYCCPLNPKIRSRMNVPFRIGSVNGDEALEKTFLTGAQERGLLQLKGHRSVGGIRASLYNAITYKEVETLVQYMKEFQELTKK
ncbi:hypothetical protein R5R35_001250 [Gryllus longicercus]|uniref:Phosphoserine aminotransferase n=1 Tax=Gryllus longicercus TaxID=2509291 RepID=A0AAN9V8U9_9ORTH